MIWPFCHSLESIIASDLIDYLASHNLINKHQHGFLKKHSTTTNLMESLNDWTLSLSNHKSVLIAYIDFQKAFDSVSHPKLLHKLSSYGIHGNLFLWISAAFKKSKLVHHSQILAKSIVVFHRVASLEVYFSISTLMILLTILVPPQPPKFFLMTSKSTLNSSTRTQALTFRHNSTIFIYGL